MMREEKIPTILGLLLLVISLAAGIVLVGQRQLFSLKASPQTTPKDVRISNITDSGFTVSWSTSAETSGAVLFGFSDSLGETAAEDKQSIIHHIDIKNLKPSATYHFKILSGKTTFDQEGKPWSQKTGPALSPKIADVISGKVETQDGKPARDALVYINAANGTTLSAKATSGGAFTVNLASIRTANLASYLSYNNQTVLSVFIKPAAGDVGSAQVAVANARPIPPLILGKTQDFRKTSAAAGGDLTSPKSGLQIEKGSQSPSPSPKPQGSSSDPEFTSTSSAKTTAKPSTTPSPTTSPKALGGSSPTPKPTASPKPSITPSPAPDTSMPGTESGVPVTGDLTTSFLLFILGIGSIFMGLVLFRKNPNI